MRIKLTSTNFFLFYFFYVFLKKHLTTIFPYPIIIIKMEDYLFSSLPK